MERWWGYTVSALFVLAILWPLQTDPPRDSFPLSTFPMFTQKRPSHADLDHVVGIGGERNGAIPPSLVASREVLQTQVTIKRTVRRGRRAVRKFCGEIAARVAKDRDLDWVQRIEIRGDRYMVLGYFSSSKKPIRSRVHARCKVSREAKP